MNLEQIEEYLYMIVDEQASIDMLKYNLGIKNNTSDSISLESITINLDNADEEEIKDIALSLLQLVS